MMGVHMNNITSSILVLAASVLFAGAAIAGDSILGVLCIILGIYLFIDGYGSLIRAGRHTRDVRKRETKGGSP